MKLVHSARIAFYHLDLHQYSTESLDVRERALSIVYQMVIDLNSSGR